MIARYGDFADAVGLEADDSQLVETRGSVNAGTSMTSTPQRIKRIDLRPGAADDDVASHGTAVDGEVSLDQLE